MMELRNAGIQTRDIAQAVEKGIIEKIKPGLYKLVDYPYGTNMSVSQMSVSANMRAVICLVSAASYYELTTFNPSEVYVAVPNNTDKFVLKYPPIKVYYFANSYYSPGIETLKYKKRSCKNL